MAVAICSAISLGIAAGVYLEEYARKNRLTSQPFANISLSIIPREKRLNPSLRSR